MNAKCSEGNGGFKSAPCARMFLTSTLTPAPPPPPPTDPLLTPQGLESGTELIPPVSLPPYLGCNQPLFSDTDGEFESDVSPTNFPGPEKKGKRELGKGAADAKYCTMSIQGEAHRLPCCQGAGSSVTC